MPISGPSNPFSVRFSSAHNGLRIIAMTSLYNMAMTAFLSMIPLCLVVQHDLLQASVGTVFSALLIAGVLAQPWFGRITAAANQLSERQVSGSQPII